jgi:hypothetical protein
MRCGALSRGALCTASGQGVRLGAMAHAMQLSMAALHEHVLQLPQRNDLAAESDLDQAIAKSRSPSVTA